VFQQLWQQNQQNRTENTKKLKTTSFTLVGKETLGGFFTDPNLLKLLGLLLYKEELLGAQQISDC